MTEERLKILKFAQEELETHKKKLKESISETEMALELLARREKEEKSLTYLVSLQSMWQEEGEKNFSDEHRGTLGWAIQSAEESFKSLNHRGDVQARYFVDLKLDKVTISLPEKYWKKYTQQTRGKTQGKF